MSEEIKIITPDFVKVNVTNSKNETVSFENKFSRGIKIIDLKNKLEIITGGCSNTMQLELYNGDKFICMIDNNDRLLGSYPIDDAMRLHVKDAFSCIAENVEKFELSEQEYEKKGNSLRSFLKQNKLGKYNQEEMRNIEEKKKKLAEEENEKAKKCILNSRCQVNVKGQPSRRGTIRYNGPLEGKRGVFIGVEYDEPLGTNNGSFDNKIYFECKPKYGSFVSPTAVEVGDFPPEEDGLDDEL